MLNITRESEAVVIDKDFDSDYHPSIKLPPSSVFFNTRTILCRIKEKLEEGSKFLGIKVVKSTGYGQFEEDFRFITQLGSVATYYPSRCLYVADGVVPYRILPMYIESNGQTIIFYEIEEI